MKKPPTWRGGGDLLASELVALSLIPTRAVPVNDEDQCDTAENARCVGHAPPYLNGQLRDAQTQPTRRAPHNLEVEQALLGAILLNNEALDRVSSFLSAEHFFDPSHAELYKLMQARITAGRLADPFTLKATVQDWPRVGVLPFEKYLGTLAANATSIINAEDYGRTIYDLATRRALIILGEDMVAGAYDSPVNFSPQVQIEEAEARLRDIGRSYVEVSRPGEIVFATNAKLELAADYVVKGLIPSKADVAVFGPSGSGKTFSVLEIAYCIACGRAYRGRRVKHGSVLYVPYEGHSGLQTRIIAANSEYGDPGKAFGWLISPGPLGGDPANHTHEQAIIHAAKTLAVKSGLPCLLIVIDTLARALGGDNENEAQAIAALLSRVQRIRTATGASVVLIHHPGKNGRGRPSQRHERILDGIILVAKSEWRSACRTKGLSDTGEEEAEKKAFVRAVRDLEKRGLVAAFGEDVWLIKGTPTNGADDDA